MCFCEYKGNVKCLAHNKRINGSGVITNNDNGSLINITFPLSSSTGWACFNSQAVFHPKPISFCHGIVFFKKKIPGACPNYKRR